MRAASFAALLVAFATPAAGQEKPDIDAAERAALKADENARELRLTADAADAKVRKARFDAIALARRIQDGEVRATRIESRIARLEILARQQRARLADKQGEVSRLLAALQTLSRRPAGLVLLEPRTAVTTARVSALLSAVRPALAERTRTLRAELAETQRLRTQLVDANKHLQNAKAALAANVRALDALQADARTARDRFDAEADAERLRARRLASRAIDLRELARAVERDAGSDANRPPQRASVARNDRRVGGFGYRMPVAGATQLGFGRRNDVGVRARGLTLATRDNAQVTAPAGGRIAYAGPFRAYGDIVIIEHEGDMLSLISGMERVDVVVGEAVRTGTPIGRMGSARPELYLELRSDSRPVDPALYAQGRG